MIEYKGINILEGSLFFVTGGLYPIIGKEIKININESSNTQYLNVLKYLIDYILIERPIIADGQTIGYHSWICKFVAKEKDIFLLYEAHSSGNDYVVGVDYAIKVLSEQQKQCERQNVSGIFPSFNQNVVISKGVYEGLSIEAVRYRSPEHMTGWWLTTEAYDDNIESLINVHFYHVAFKRPEILKYLALPFGFRFFFKENTEEIWYDSKVLE